METYRSTISNLIKPLQQILYPSLNLLLIQTRGRRIGPSSTNEQPRDLNDLTRDGNSETDSRAGDNSGAGSAEESSAEHGGVCGGGGGW